jgi:hypothetical protein
MGAERAEPEGSEVAARPQRAAPARELDAVWLARTVGNRAFGQIMGRRPAGGASPSGPPVPRQLVTGKLPAGVDPEQVEVTGLWDWVKRQFTSPATAPNTPAPAGPVSPAQPPPPRARAAPTTPSPRAPAPPTPAKLSYGTIDPATGGDCGQFSWAVQWVLDRPSPSGGWVVQRVSVERNVKDAAGHDVAGGLNTSWYPMWEAWPVSAGQKVTKYVQDDATDNKDDTYAQTSIPSSTGTVKVIGSAEFYEGLTLPSEFKVTNQAPAWILPTTKSSPPLPGGTGAIAHTIQATWNCATGSDKRTTVTPS